MTKYLRRGRSEVLDARTGLFPSDAPRFWRDVRKGGPDECWMWIGPVNEDGYGILRAGGKSNKAHRVSYLLARGAVPSELEVCHSCDRPACVNPAHLFVGSHAENMADCRRKNRNVRPPVGPGVAAPAAKLTDDIVLQIRRLYAAGVMSQREIAARFGITQTNVSMIVRRKTWAHL